MCVAASVGSPGTPLAGAVTLSAADDEKGAAAAAVEGIEDPPVEDAATGLDEAPPHPPSSPTATNDSSTRRVHPIR